MVMVPFNFLDNIVHMIVLTAVVRFFDSTLSRHVNTHIHIVKHIQQPPVWNFKITKQKSASSISSIIVIKVHVKNSIRPFSLQLQWSNKNSIKNCLWYRFTDTQHTHSTHTNKHSLTTNGSLLVHKIICEWTKWHCTWREVRQSSFVKSHLQTVSPVVTKNRSATEDSINDL